MSTTATVTSVIYNIPEVNSGTTTSWIPVTTAWPSSSGCASSFFLFPGQPAPVAWDPGYGYFDGGEPRCLPPAATTWWEQNHQNGDGFTSLSIRPIVCPAAFTTAATSIQSGSSTLVVCCPSGYHLQNGEPGRAVGTCTSPLISGQTITYLASFTNGISSTTSAVKSPTFIEAIQFEGWNIATPAASSAICSPPSILAPSSPLILSPSITSTCQSCSTSGLSASAKGTIGAGAAIGAIGIITLILAFFILRRRPKIIQYAAVPPKQEAESISPIQKAHIHEMSGHLRPAELPSA